MREIEFYSPEEVHALVRRASSPQDRVLFLTAALTTADGGVARHTLKDVAYRYDPRNEINAMTITIGSSTFDNVFYDADVDVLYLHVGDPSSAVDFDGSPEGHALRFDADGRLVGVTIVGVKSLIDREGELTITLREIVHVDSDTVAPALVGA